MIVKNFKGLLLSALPLLLLLLALATVLLPFGGGSGDAALIDEMIAIEGLGSPLISSDFNVYLDQDQNRLIYTRDQCVHADLSALFFLHVIPVDVGRPPRPPQAIWGRELQLSLRRLPDPAARAVRCRARPS